jgi:hypothetical protein
LTIREVRDLAWLRERRQTGADPTGHAGDVVATDVDLASVDADADRDPRRGAKGRGATDRAHRTVERREDGLVRGADHAAAVGLDAAADDIIVGIERTGGA